jgi:circadian clock protein KaiB
MINRRRSLVPISEDLNENPEDTKWEFRLYIAGQTVKSLRATANLQRLCEDKLAGQYLIDIVDLSEHPELARTDDIVALPTLVRTYPLPHRRIIGDLSDSDRVTRGLEILET